MWCVKIDPLEGGTFTAPLFHRAVGSACLCLFGLFTKGMWDITVAWCWTQCPVQKLWSRFKVLLPCGWQAPVWKLERVRSLCCSPCPAARAAALAYVRLGPHPGLVPPAPAASGTASPQSSLPWLRAGGALTHAVLPHLTAALAPCEHGRQQCLQLPSPSWKEFSC